MNSYYFSNKSFAYFDKNDLLNILINVEKTYIFICPKSSRYSIGKNFFSIRFIDDINSIFKGNFNKGSKYILDEFSHLQNGLDVESAKLMNSILQSILLAINCNMKRKHFAHLQDVIKDEFTRELKSIKSQYKLESYFPEVFWSHHGLRFANKKILDYVLNRDILDIGSYCGDSLTVLLNYTNRKVCSIEYSPLNMKMIKEAIEANHLNKSKIILLNKGVSNQTEIIKTKFNQQSDSTIHKENDGESIQLTTIDEIVEQNNLSVGFMKADIEGMEIQALQGAVKTIRKDRPIISFSIYHNLQSLFGLRHFIEQFPNYAFKYHIGSWRFNTLGELILFAYPNELS